MVKRLRWKRRYQTGDIRRDTENKQLTQCLNNFVEASRAREHCQDMEEVIGGLVHDADQALRHQRPRNEIAAGLRHALRDALPLASYQTAACKRCGICELIKAEGGEQLASSAKCLGLGSPRRND